MSPSGPRRCPNCGAALMDEICVRCENTRAGDGELDELAWDSTPATPPQVMRRPDLLPSPEMNLQRPPGARRRSRAKRREAEVRFPPGTVFADRYRIVSTLGKGGMGEVFRAEDLKLGETVALKFLSKSVEDPTRLELFLNEARMARRVTHQNVCRVHDVSETDDGEHFISMEYVDGEDLASLLRRIGRLPVAKALEIAREICAGLDAAHRQSILHRDLKPRNIMLDGTGRTRLTDFGLAGLVGSGTWGGTPAYMAPEQYGGGEVNEKTDLYALGLVLYELFTGRRAFEARSTKELARKQLEERPPAPSNWVEGLDLAIERVILDCLEKVPERRPASARIVSDTLAQIDVSDHTLSGGVSSDRSASRPFAEGSSGWRHLQVAAGIVVAVAIAVVFGIPFLPPGELPQREPTVTGPAGTPELGSAPQAIEIRPSLAVLRPRNLTGDADADWIAAAVAEMMTSELGTGGALRTLDPGRIVRAQRELELADTETLAPADLERLHTNLGAEFVAFGTYARITGTRLLRLDLRLYDARTGKLLASAGVGGSDQQLFDLIGRAGESLQTALPVDARTLADEVAARAALPTDPEALRFYVVGLGHLRHQDLRNALDPLRRAVSTEPDHPMPHAALADLWWRLGNAPEAALEGRKAVERATGLAAVQRREIDALVAKFESRWDDAAAAYRELVALAPDDVFHRVDLAEAQLDGGWTPEALVTIDETRQLLGEHPRLDFIQAKAHRQQGEHEAEQLAAARAAEGGAAIGAWTLVADARLQEALAWYRLGDLEAQAIALEEARHLFESLGDRAGVARSLQQMATSRWIQGDSAVARRQYQRCLELYREVGDETNVAGVLANLANLTELWDPEWAKELYEESIDLLRRFDRRLALGKTLLNFGTHLQVHGELDGAIERYEEAIVHLGAVGDRDNQAIVWHNLGELLLDRGELVEARENLVQAIAIHREVGNQSNLGYALVLRATLHVARGDTLVARARFDEAVELLDRIGTATHAAEARLGLARLDLAEGRTDAATKLAGEAEQVFREAEWTDMAAAARVVLGEIRLARDDLDGARRLSDELREIVDASKDPRLRFPAAIFRARVLLIGGEADAALAALDRARREAEERGLVRWVFEIRLAAASIAVTAELPGAAALLDAVAGDAETKGFAGVARQAREKTAEISRDFSTEFGARSRLDK